MMAREGGWVPLDVKSISTVLVIVTSIVGSYAVLHFRVSADAERIAELEENMSASAKGDAQQDLALAVIQSTVSDLKLTVGEMKGQQQAFQHSTDSKLNEQTKTLNNILWELRKHDDIP